VLYATGDRKAVKLETLAKIAFRIDFAMDQDVAWPWQGGGSDRQLA
jgi:hypothetical protein